MACMRDMFRPDVALNGRFQTISPLNQGTFGMVFTAKDLLTGNPVAVKCLTKTLPDDTDVTCPAAMAVDERSEEVEVHSRIGYHPNIVNLITSFDTATHSYLVLEYCPNGDLYEAIRAAKGPLETEHVRDFMLQLVNAVDYMHQRGIYHRDIKPENIFLSQSGSMKLGDFGLATFESWTTEYGVGSDRYMAPEQFEASSVNGYSPAAADVWAIGICLLNVLFGRNPFATPTPSDPLFADYVRDRQSLFDVFPNMSEDTFNILMHCMTLDASKRSLSAVREALENVISFTTDDESLDDFCTGFDDAHKATVNREPLRTPSVSSPQVDNGTSFPWAKALQATPQKATRQLSVIQDSEELYPEPSKPLYSVETASLASALDSGIGMSYKSTNAQSSTLSVPASSSLPITGSSTLASFYSKDHENFSKSWSDLWEEEEEEMHRSSFESTNDIERVSTAKPVDTETTRSSTPAIDIAPSSRGSSTPRMSLAEMKSANSRSNSPTDFRHRITSHVKQLALSAPQRYSPPKRTGSSLMDKWAALGNMRRNSKMDVPTTPPRTKDSGDKNTIAFLDDPKTNTRKPRERSSSWRKNTNGPQPATNGVWSLSKDWRSPQQSNYTTAMPSATTFRSAPLTSPSALRRKSPRRSDVIHHDDVGDLEWVGGWQDLQL